MKKRKRTFDERRGYLRDTLVNLDNAIGHYEETRAIGPLRAVAIYLRALVGSGRGNGILISLAEERQYPLIVYTFPPSYQKKVLALKPGFYTQGDMAMLEPDERCNTPTTLAELMRSNHVLVAGELCTLEACIKMVADTEAAHLDDGRPILLDEMSNYVINGLEVPMRTVYTLGRIVRHLGFALLRNSI